MFMLMILSFTFQFLDPNDIDEQLNTLSAIEDSIAAIRSWMSEDKLKLNEGMTEFLLVGTKQQLAKLSFSVTSAPSSRFQKVTFWRPSITKSSP